MGAVFGLEPRSGSSSPAQTQRCAPVSTDIAAPTNVVFKAQIGDTVSVRLEHGDLAEGDQSVECQVTQDAFGEAIGTPGNVFVNGFIVSRADNKFGVSFMCSAGLDQRRSGVQSVAGLRAMGQTAQSPQAP
jgi:hypothetical protein